MQNAINWFEIPSTNIDRAVKFYDTILSTTLRREVFLGIPNGVFPADERGVAGAVIQSDVPPSNTGTVLYLNAVSPDKLHETLAKVGSAGGSVVTPVTSLGPQGWFAVIEDTEGNRIGLHSPVA
jgi:uncharacterized protein